MTALLDTGLLLAVLDSNDDLHTVSTLVLEEESEPILPDMVLPELSYLVQRELDTSILVQFLRAVVGGELKIEQNSLARFWDSRLNPPRTGS